MSDLVGGSGLPVGTKDEVLALGQSLAKWATCSERDPNLKSRGCIHFPECIFAFKNSGPKNVGVYIKADTGASVERSMPCHVYMETLHKRSLSGDESGEVIAVVAHEGEAIEVKETVSAEPRSKTDFRVKTTTKSQNIAPFPRPGEDGSLMGPEFLATMKIEARLKDKARVMKMLHQQGISVADLAAAERTTSGKETPPAGPPKRG